MASNATARLAVVGDCFASTGQLREGLDAVSEERWGELTDWAGSYWVVAENHGHRFVCGDLAGSRGVFYTVRSDQFAWATRATLLADRFDLEPDLALLTARLVVGETHWPDRSCFENLRVVPGGYGLLLGGAVPQLVDVTRVRPATDLRVGAHRFGHALTEAVQMRVTAADGETGADLSGGFDSSAAVLLAAEAGRVQAVTYTDAYTSGEDASYAARVAEHAGVAHHIAAGGPGELPFGFATGQPVADQPVLSAANFHMDALYLDPVVGRPLHLTGHGGDVVLDATSACWVRMVQDGQRREAQRQVTAWARMRNKAPGTYWRSVREVAAVGRRGALMRAAEELERGPVKEVTSAASWSWCRLGPAAAWLTGEGRAQVASLLRLAAGDQQPDEADTFEEWASLRAVGAWARDGLPLLHAIGVRPVHPYLDNRVVRTAFAVPSTARRGVVTYKPLLREALPDLPQWLADRRSKGSFSSQRIVGLMCHRTDLHRLIAASPFVGEGLVDPAAAHASLESAASGQDPTAIPFVHQLLVSCWWLAGRGYARALPGAAA